MRTGSPNEQQGSQGTVLRFARVRGAIAEPTGRRNGSDHPGEEREAGKVAGSRRREPDPPEIGVTSSGICPPVTGPGGRTGEAPGWLPGTSCGKLRSSLLQTDRFD